MAKMFYTLEEVAAKLNKSPDEVRAMAKSGQIQEFRDRDKIMFKTDQIDLLAGSDEETGDVHLDLAESAVGSGLTSSGSGLDLKEDSSIGLADSREGTGISVFDTGHGGEERSARNQPPESPSGDTQVGMETVDDELSLESVGSGSGLLDLTRESDDTSLGAELLEEVYSSDQENIEIPANASGLFEAASGDAGMETRGAVAMPMVVEVYDGAGSGLGAGLLIGAVASMICVAIVAVVGLSGAHPQLASMISGNLWVWAGGLAGITIICGLIGLFLGKASE